MLTLVQIANRRHASRAAHGASGGSFRGAGAGRVHASPPQLRPRNDPNPARPTAGLSTRPAIGDAFDSRNERGMHLGGDPAREYPPPRVIHPDHSINEKPAPEDDSQKALEALQAAQRESAQSFGL